MKSYVEVETTEAELLRLNLDLSGFGQMTVDGVNRCRSFIRNICEKHGGYRMGLQEWHALVVRFYGEKNPIIPMVYRDEFHLAALLEKVKSNPEGYLRLRLIGGVKARKAIKAGEWEAPRSEELEGVWGK